MDLVDRSRRRMAGSFLRASLKAITVSVTILVYIASVAIGLLITGSVFALLMGQPT